MKEIDRERIMARIRREIVGERLPCRRAFQIAREMGCAPAVVGALCNELGVKISGCRLGCF